MNNGASEVEIRETLLQVAMYCGMPSGVGSIRAGDAAIKQLKGEGLL